MKTLIACCLILGSMFLSKASLSQPLTLGLEPLIPSSMYQEELEPLFGYLNGLYDFKYQPAGSLKEFQKQTINAQFDFSYVSFPFYEFLKQYGYQAILVSKRPVAVVLIGKKGLNLQQVKENSKQKLYYVKNDLMSQYQAYLWKKDFNANAVPVSTGNQLIISILKEKDSVGIIAETEIGLLPKNLQDNIKVLSEGHESYLYVVAHESVSPIFEPLKKQLKSFHNNFKQNEKFHYLSHFKFQDYQATKHENQPMDQAFLKSIGLQ